MVSYKLAHLRKILFPPQKKTSLFHHSFILKKVTKEKKLGHSIFFNYMKYKMHGHFFSKSLK